MYYVLSTAIKKYNGKEEEREEEEQIVALTEAWSLSKQEVSYQPG